MHEPAPPGLFMAMNEVIRLRHDLHQEPCLSGEETPAVLKLLDFFQNYPPDTVIRNIGGEGFAVIYDGCESGPTTMFTAELDAIPVTEKSTLPYASKIQGVGHMCGHDGHMATLAALGTLLHEQRPLRGRIVLLYRPREENGLGAPLVINDPKFRSIEPDMIFGYHILPRHPLGSVVLRQEQFAWTAADVCIKLIGRSSHGGEPEDAVRPTRALIEIMTRLENFHQWPDLDLSRNHVLVGYAQLGESPLHNTAPGVAQIRGGIRSQTEKERAHLLKTVKKIVADATGPRNLKWKVYEEYAIPATHIDDKALELVKACALENGVPLVWLEEINRWSDDFGVLSAKYPGIFFGIGAGEKSSQLHSPDFDYPDRNIIVAAMLYWNIGKKINGYQ